MIAGGADNYRCTKNVDVTKIITYDTCSYTCSLISGTDTRLSGRSISSATPYAGLIVTVSSPEEILGLRLQLNT